MLKNKTLGGGVSVTVLGLLMTGGAWAGAFSRSDNATRGPELLKWEVSARSSGLGGSFVGVADDLGALFWNPAGLQRLNRAELQLNHTQVFADQTLSAASVGWPYWRGGQRETWGVGVSYLTMEPFDVVSQNTTVGRATVSEGSAALSYARPIGNLHLGATAKYVQQDLYVADGQTYAFDVGILRQSENERWAWGLSAVNMGPAMRVGQQNVALPLAIRTGVSGLFSTRSRGDWLMSVQADAPADDQPQGRLGIEYRTRLGNGWRTAVRAGARTDPAQGPWALGASLERESLALHYTFSENDTLGDVNRFEFVYRFGSPLEKEVKRKKLIREATFALRTGDLAVAQEALDQLMVLSPQYPPAKRLRHELRDNIWSTLDPAVLLRQGKQALEKNDLDTAAVFYRKLRVVQPDHPEGMAGLEQVEKHLAARQLAQTQKEVARQKERRKNELISEARQKAADRNWESALMRWQEVLSLDPKQAEAKAGVARANEQLTLNKNRQKNDQIIRVPSSPPVQKVTAESRERAAVAYEEGREAYKQGDLNRARTLFQEALQGAPDNKSIRRALERVEEEMRR